VQDLAVEDEDAAVVTHVLVDHGHADVAQDAVGKVAGKQRGDRLPAVQDGVALVKVVLAAVPGDLELGTAAVARTAGLCDADGLLNALQVAGEVHRPLVEVAGGHGKELGVDEQVERTVLCLLLLGGHEALLLVGHATETSLGVKRGEAARGERPGDGRADRRLGSPSTFPQSSNLLRMPGAPC